MNEKQFDVLIKKLDKIIGILATQNIEDIDEKIYFLRNLGFKSDEVAPFVGLTGSAVRDKKGWKKK